MIISNQYYPYIIKLQIKLPTVMPEDNAEAVKKAPRPREKIPGYLFGEVIGTGAYAKVRRCYSEKHNCHVAIKIVSKEKAPKDYLTKFLPREIKTIGNLNHENIIRVKEVSSLILMVY